MACWFELGTLIAALVIIEKIARDLGQAVAVIVIRRRRPEIKLPFKMWLFPLPALVALAGWLYILGTNQRKIVLWGIALMVAGLAAYLWQARVKREWPFSQDDDQ